MLKTFETEDPIVRGLRKVIDERGYIQAAVARRAGMKPQQLTDMLHGRKIIRAMDLFRLAAALGVSAQDIFDAGMTE